MQIAVASGKGGTGKTMVSTSLALCAQGGVQYLDCDVEGPKSHIFLKPRLTESSRQTVTIPRIRTDHCSYCGKCRNICRFNAITMFGQTIMALSELCRSCRGCFSVCEDNAIFRDTREIGVLERGWAGDIDFVHGRMRVGESMAVPLIKKVKRKAQQRHLVIIDAPSGISSPFVEAVSDSDFVLVISEPTSFGLHSLKKIVQVLRRMAKPCGVVLNRADLGDERLERWCRVENIKVLLKIPFDRAIAEGNARGTTLLASRPIFRHPLENLLEEISQ